MAPRAGALKVSARVESDGAPQLAQSVDRALTILEAFSARRPELGVNELARILDTTPSTASRILAALEARGYVVQDEGTGRFRLGVRALELGYRFADTSELMSRAAPHVDALAQQLKLRVDVYGLDGGQLVRFMSATFPPGQTMVGGWRFYPYTSAAGRVLLAALPPDALRATLEHDRTLLAPRAAGDGTDLAAQLDAARQRGYSMDDDAAGIGKRSLAVPVRDAAGDVVAALAVVGPASRLADEDLPGVLEVLFDRAFEFSKSLGYRPHQALCEPPP